VDKPIVLAVSRDASSVSDHIDPEPDRGVTDATDSAPASSVRRNTVEDVPRTPATRPVPSRRSQPSIPDPATDDASSDSDREPDHESFVEATRDTINSPRATAELAGAGVPRRSRTQRNFLAAPAKPKEKQEKKSDPLSETLAAAASSYDDVSIVPSLPSLDDEHAADPLIGMVVADRYRIVERIGRGGMGIVYRVEHTRIGKLLAMKLLAGELSANKEVVRRFKLEALTVSKLSNPHTVQVFDYGVWQHLTYLMMELVDGLDLSRALRRSGPIPFARLGRLTAQVCASLSEAHGKGIVHRDIKPENIMIIADERGAEMAKVLDFGLAKLRENADLNEVTLQGAVIGTPYYMSPEQVLGEDVDGRSDIYSLGAVMYRALTGNYPFTATSPMAMFTKHLTEAPPVINETHPELNVPKGVSDAVLRCMQKNKTDRFATIEELRDLLITEINALGLPSSEMLFVSDRASLADQEEVKRDGKREREGKRKRRANDLAMIQIATREELEAYETKLQRKRYGVWALGAMMVLAGGAAGVWYGWIRSKPMFRGEEIEPNNSAADANELPMGKAMRGRVGPLVDLPMPGGATTRSGDRDFFRLDVPDGAQRVSLRLEPLPNFGICAMVYRVGITQTLAQFCSGQMGGQPVWVPSLRLDPGAYFIAVVQDRNPSVAFNNVPPFYENVSDGYRLTIDRVSDGTDDVEPNDSIEGAQPIEPQQEVSGTMGFVADEDWFCAPKPGGVRWVVEDGKRRFGTVLEATPYSDGSAGPMVRLHLAQSSPPQKRARLDADVDGAWTSAGCAQAQCCLRLRLVRDPWIVDADTTVGPLPDETRYRVKLEPAK
jgi:serine/threonine-protein kinase